MLPMTRRLRESQIGFPRADGEGLLRPRGCESIKVKGGAVSSWHGSTRVKDVLSATIPTTRCSPNDLRIRRGTKESKATTGDHVCAISSASALLETRPSFSQIQVLGSCVESTLVAHRASPIAHLLRWVTLTLPRTSSLLGPCTQGRREVFSFILSFLTKPIDPTHRGLKSLCFFFTGFEAKKEG